ncbi:orotate phosphoribosyltransferase [Pseudovibrio exalbescens]|uniref:orotate phosphoribosyltransferase n=1 Tax=Pseudovibrio exalbescens TaxID=197461 RepID=UPI00236607EE|nr:orotate phosphoribosyltransferase [Pseudovibrio exalbescens]MDD7908368.1 orotate phosphoribosyltransferase [Pseudovibrio exalbescens]
MTMTRDEVLDTLRSTGAVSEGHFILPSGLRSPTLIDRSRLFMYPCHLQRLCQELERKLRVSSVEPFDHIVSISRANMVLGYELARQLDLISTWMEKDGGQTKLIGSDLTRGARLLVVEDVVNTGASSREAIHALESLGMKAVGVCCLIDRSAGDANLDLPLVSLIDLTVPAYPADRIPAQLQAIPAISIGNPVSG